MNAYDSTTDTKEHILRVRELLYIVQNQLEARGFSHDQSKLREPEKSAFDIATPKLRSLTYGSPEYKESIAALGPALQNHYALNSHHPEHFTRGIGGMSLLDLIEMLCDWKAAGERHADGTMAGSLQKNKGRFQISDQLNDVLINTAVEMGWV